MTTCETLWRLADLEDTEVPEVLTSKARAHSWTLGQSPWLRDDDDLGAVDGVVECPVVEDGAIDEADVVGLEPR